MEKTRLRKGRFPALLTHLMFTPNRPFASSLKLALNGSFLFSESTVAVQIKVVS